MIQLTTRLALIIQYDFYYYYVVIDLYICIRSIYVSLKIQNSWVLYQLSYERKPLYISGYLIIYLVKRCYLIIWKIIRAKCHSKVVCV